MKGRLKNLWLICLVALLGVNSLWCMSTLQEHFRETPVENRADELWMGIYMGGVKVGHSHIRQILFSKEGKSYKKSSNESWMKVSRLGGSAVEIKTVQESLYDALHRPIQTAMRVKMSENETVIQAEIGSRMILFKLGGKIIKELPYEGDVFLEVPLESIINNEGLNPGRKYVFKVLDPFSYSLSEAHFEIIGEEEVFILGKKMRLWHVRTEIDYIIPLVADEWVDEAGHIWRSDSQTSFLTTTSIRMSKEKALKISEDNFDIAFSTIIKPASTIENPRSVKAARYKLVGISSEKIRNLPFDNGSQEILELKDGHALIQTTSQVFREEDSITLAAVGREVQEYLKPTSFCQSDDPEIVDLARGIIGREQNAWRAAKKIAEWVNREIAANYDVGFASAKEVLKNREGDCSEYTVITVALCRAAGVPARAALGVMYGQDLFAYHMWPEVFVGRWIGLDAKWVAVDEQSGEYYTDATHIKFGRSDLDANIFKEMALAISEILGKLNIEIIEYSHKK